ncbi:MAG TPA: hypothetical protein VMY76_09745 [Gemmatimonadales bacterium]|nr:hypothetical protein [Gemmatimonadales bacterium]
MRFSMVWTTLLRRCTRHASPLLRGLACIVVPLPLAAQSVSPPIAEYQERARSSYQLINSTLFPLSVVLEVRGFQVTEAGEVQDAPLDTTKVRVKLSAMSFRIPPRATYTVFYEAAADSAPAWFNIVSALTGAKTDNGLNVRILLPHVVYLNQKEALRRDEVVVRAFELDTAAKKARVQLENLGPRLGRVQQVTASTDKTTSPPSAGFPLFPHMLRWTEIDWNQAVAPDRLSVRFARFSIDTALAPVPTP